MRNKPSTIQSLSHVLILDLLALLFLIFTGNVRAELINGWTNGSSAHWEDGYWSLGILPGTGQSVYITNSGYKAVGVFPQTPVNYPGSMVMSNLTIGAPANALSVLLLNYFGTAVPLQVNGRCLINSNGTLMNLYSALRVDSDITINGGQYVEEGGTISPTNVPFYIQNGGVRLTNATLTVGSMSFSGSSMVQSGGSLRVPQYILSGTTFDLVGGILNGDGYIGAGPSGGFRQFSGTNSGSLSIGIPFVQWISGDGTYTLYDGVCIAPGIGIGAGGDGSVGTFTQSGGTVMCGYLSLGVGYTFRGFPARGMLSISAGNLFAGSVSLQNGSMSQQGGQVVVTNSLGVWGNFEDYGTSTFANYSLSAGTLFSHSIGLGIFGTFGQTGGTNFVWSELGLQDTAFNLSGGVLSTSNTVVNHGSRVTSDGYHFHSEFDHRGGSHRVRNNLIISDYYNFYAGDLTVKGVELSGILGLYADMPAASFTNTGVFHLAGGTIALHTNVAHNLGPAGLSANSLITLFAGSQLKFLNSSAISWTNGVWLSVTNWNGSKNGGGSDRIYFGSDAGGLTSAQLAQVQFLNPPTFPPGNYSARILPTGEVVPTGSLFVAGWGSDSYGLATAPGGLNGVTAIACGPFIAMALRTNQTVVSWGADPENFYYGHVKLPDGLTNVVAITAGDELSLGLLADSTVVASGGGIYSPYTPPSGLSNVVGIAAGEAFGAAVRKNGTVIAWGLNQFGQTNVPPGLSNVVALSAGKNFTVALKADGTVASWGDNYYDVTNVPPGLSNVVQVSARDYHALALRADGGVTGWGDYLGTNIPPGLSNVVSIAAGRGFNLALRPDGTILSWNGVSAPTNVAPFLTNVVAIAAGGYVGLAILETSYPHPFSLTSPQKKSNGSVTLALSGHPGQHYTIQSSPDLVQWSFWRNAAGDFDPIPLVDEPVNLRPQRFLRALRVP